MLITLEPGQQVPVQLVHSDGTTAMVTVSLTDSSDPP